MDSVTAYEAKTHLSALLARAGEGETITITRHGHPIARLVPATEPRDTRATIAALRATRARLTLGDVSARELIDDGRRY